MVKTIDSAYGHRSSTRIASAASMKTLTHVRASP